MDSKKLLAICIGFVLISLVMDVNISTPQQTATSSIFAERPKIDWNEYKPLRVVNEPRLGKILCDIESHMKEGHQYSEPNNLVTWVHETTHGINSILRNSHKDAAFVNAFYCLENRYKIFYEPKTTISDVARRVPVALRGPSYQMYLVDQVKWWNEKPFYIMDEWISYTNGSACALELKEQEFYFELLQAQNFMVYSIYLLMSIKERDAKYDCKELIEFIKWNSERVISMQRPLKTLRGRDLVVNLFRDPLAANQEYMQKLKTLAEAESFRNFSRKNFGDLWCKQVLGF
jgi:hypothetical protein